MRLEGIFCGISTAPARLLLRQVFSELLAANSAGACRRGSSVGAGGFWMSGNSTSISRSMTAARNGHDWPLLT